MNQVLNNAPGAAAHDHQPQPGEQAAFELGWDFARHGLPLPAPYGQEDSALRHGWAAGQAAFRGRALQAGEPVRQWLQLRLRAWLRGRHVELFQVTPHLLKQLAVDRCPITRAELGGAGANGASVDRVRNDAGYASGNLGVMSLRANNAKGAKGHAQALAMARQVEAGPHGGQEGLTAAQWHRVATWCSFVEPLSHADACAVPLRVLPPNRLRLFNPAQALQAFVSQQLLQPGWSHRVSRFEALLPGDALRRDFKRFFLALLPRVLEAGKPAGPQEARWAVEDAWANDGVMERWTRFALQLTPSQCETLLKRAHARRLGTCRIDHQPADQATEGWQLETRGYTPVRPARPYTEIGPGMVQLSLLG